MGTLIAFNVWEAENFAQDIEEYLPLATGKDKSARARLRKASLTDLTEIVIIRRWVRQLCSESSVELPEFETIYVSQSLDRTAIGLTTNHAFALVLCDIERLRGIIQNSSAQVFSRTPSQLSNEECALVANSLVNQTNYTLVPVKDAVKDKASAFGELFTPSRERDDGDGL